MRPLKVALVAFVWVLSLLAVGVWAQLQGPEAGGVQTRQLQPGDPDGAMIVSGDIGFQPVVDMHGSANAVSGKWMVRINGRWVEARPASGPMRAR